MGWRDLVDGLLELAVVPSFSALGPRLRGRLWGWTAPDPDALRGRTAVVTGATGGLGRATAHALAGLGARVVLVGRDAGRLEQLAADLRADLGGTADDNRFPIQLADMADLADVRAAARAIAASEPVIDLVVDNAGMIYAERTATADGTEASMALMVVGPFVLVSGLLPSLRRASDARVIAVTSGGMYAQGLDVGDLDGLAIEYSGPRFYARAKRAQVAIVREWARRLRGTPLTFVSMHPGWARTPGLSASLPGFERVMGPILRTPEEGIDTITWLATAPRAALEAGGLYLDRRPRPFDRAPWTRLSDERRRALWAEVVRRSGGADPAPA